MTMCQVSIFIIMNIKRIIKEAMDDFDWAKNIEPMELFDITSNYMITGVPPGDVDTKVLDKLYELYGEEFIDKNRERISVLNNNNIQEYGGPIVIYMDYEEAFDDYIYTNWDYDDSERVTEDDEEYGIQYTYNQFLNLQTQDQLMESDDFDWVTNPKPSSFVVGDCVLYYNVRWTITSIDDGKLTVNAKDFNGEIDPEWLVNVWPEENVMGHIKNGTMTRCVGDEDYLRPPE